MIRPVATSPKIVTRCILSLHMHFADMPAVVTRRVQARGPGVRPGLWSYTRTTHLAQIPPRQHARPAHHANRRRHRRVREDNAVRRQTIQIRRLHHGIAHESRRMPAQIIRHDEKNIRTRCGRCREAKETQCKHM